MFRSIATFQYIYNSLMQAYHLDLLFFIVVLLISVLFFYCGYFFILYGSSRKLTAADIFHFRITKKFRWSIQTTVGVILHMLGRILPYLYILLYGRKLPLWIYIVVIFALVLTVVIFLKKLLWDRRPADLSGVSIIRHDIVEAKDVPILWKIYNDTFEPINKISPCRQSFDEAHFLEVLEDPTVQKYVLSKKEDVSQRGSRGGSIIGIALITNNFKNLPWISWEYYQEHFPDEFSKKLIYYFIGLAIDKKYRGHSYSISLIEHIIDDIPHGGIMGFDHSHNINPMLHHFTRIVHQAKSIRRLHLDGQHYHLVRRK